MTLGHRKLDKCRGGRRNIATPVRSKIQSSNRGASREKSPRARPRGCAGAAKRLYPRAKRRDGPLMKHQKSTSFVAGRAGRADRGTFMGTVRLLLPYIWPSDRADLRLRVLLAIVLMIASKLFTIATPYAFKWVTD